MCLPVRTQRNFTNDASIARPTDQLSFVAIGDTNRPNGGILARFPDLARNRLRRRQFSEARRYDAASAATTAWWGPRPETGNWERTVGLSLKSAK